MQFFNKSQSLIKIKSKIGKITKNQDKEKLNMQLGHNNGCNNTVKINAIIKLIDFFCKNENPINAEIPPIIPYFVIFIIYIYII